MDNLHSGDWWRFTRYTIRDSCIFPAPDAGLQTYDPWEAYAREHSGEHSEPSYVAFLNLVRQATLQTAPKGRRIGLTAESEAAVLAWCAKFGLPGVLLQRVLSVTLAPRWMAHQIDADLNGFFSPTDEPPSRYVRPVLFQYLRNNSGWTRVQFTVMDDPDTRIRPHNKKWVNQLVTTKDWPDCPTPQVIIRDGLVGPGHRSEDLATTWASFFPAVPRPERNTFLYPVPPSEEFWRIYAEPLDDFFDAGHHLLTAAQVLVQPDQSPNDSGSDETFLREEGLAVLNAFLSSVNPVALSAPNSTDFTWSAPSLLAIFAMMMAQDRRQGRRLLMCPECQRYFVTSAYQGKYCSSACRFRVLKRGQRARKKESS